MLTVKTRMKPIKMPKVNFQDDLKVIADQIIIPDMQRGIVEGVDISGNSFPANDPATIKAKGHSQVLVGKEQKLLSSFRSKNHGKYKVKVFLAPERKEIGKYLQVDGIRAKSGKKHFEFFGISNDAEAKALKYMKKKINQAVKSAN